MRAVVAAGALVALAGCSDAPSTPKPHPGPKPQLDVLSVDVTAIEVDVDGRKVSCVLAAGHGYADVPSLSCDWGSR